MAQAIKTPYICDFCNETFSEKRQLDRHKFYIHTGIKNYKCTFDGCDKEYLNYANLNRHIKSVHENESEEHNPINIRPSYTCEICHEKFRKKDQLDRHNFHIHTGIKSYKCSYNGCDKEYTNNSHLKRHIKSVHEKTKIETEEFPCPDASCRQLFSNYTNMRRHFRVKHEIAKPYQCQECAEVFARKLQLRQHVIRHTGDYPYKCPHCPKGFVNKNSFDKHMTVHNDLYRSSHKCQDCSKEFHKWSDLMAHRKIEHVLRFECDFCHKQFFSKHNLKHHFRLHKPEDDRLVYPCHFENCPKFYFEKRNLNAHIRSKHEGKKFICDVSGCGRELSTKQKLEQHMKLHRSSARNVKPKKPPAKRKDAGQKRLEITKLLNVNLEPSIQEKIREGKGMDINVILDQGEYSEFSETELGIHNSKFIPIISINEN